MVANLRVLLALRKARADPEGRMMRAHHSLQEEEVNVPKKTVWLVFELTASGRIALSHWDRIGWDVSAAEIRGWLLRRMNKRISVEFHNSDKLHNSFDV